MKYIKKAFSCGCEYRKKYCFVWNHKTVVEEINIRAINSKNKVSLLLLGIAIEPRFGHSSLATSRFIFEILSF